MERGHFRRDGGMCFDGTCTTRPVMRVIVVFRPVMKTEYRGILAKPQLVSERPFSGTFLEASVQLDGDVLKVTADGRVHTYPMQTVAEWVTDVVDLCEKTWGY